jgi:hypothetical protein
MSVDLLNIPDCSTPDTQFNTGVPLCDLIKRKLIGIVFADAGVFFTPTHRASKAAFLAEFAAKCFAARGSRIFPLWNIRNFNDQTGQPQTGGVGNLVTTNVKMSDEIPAFEIGYKGGEIQHQILSNVENGNYSVYLVDEAYTFYGTTSGVNMVGFSTEQIKVAISKFPTSDFVNQYSFSITFGSAIEFKSQSAFMKLSNAVTANKGLVNVTGSLFSQVSNVVKIMPIAAGGTNLEVLYGTLISALSFTAKNVQTGAAFTVTSTADDATNDAYTVTLDSTAYGLLATGESVDIYGPTPAAMAGASVKFYEFIPFRVTKP